jgi:hypothetical protein
MALNTANDTLTRYPSLFQINTRMWLTELSRALAVPRLRDEGRVASQDNPIGRTLWPVS